MPVLHMHMPHVACHSGPCLEETWFHTAAIESWLPLIAMLEDIRSDGPEHAIAMSVSPTLMEMASEASMRERLRQYADDMLALAGKEAARTAGGAFHDTALMYLDRARAAVDALARYDGGILGCLRELAAGGGVEFMTTAATHAYLPNLAPFAGLLRLQIRLGRECFRRHMGFEPVGFWLPECGFEERVGKALGAEGVGYTFLEEHGLTHARPAPGHGVYAPCALENSVALFGRDPFTARRVWSAETGYPADSAYRDFHADIGMDREASGRIPHIAEFMAGYTRIGAGMHTGFKYMRVTGGYGPKAPYEPEAATLVALRHAEDFIAGLKAHAAGLGIKRPLYVAPYDAELFGHWWHEGVQWLGHVLRLAAKDSRITLVTPGECLREAGELQRVSPQLSSWGRGGYGAAWTEPKGGWAGEALTGAAMAGEALLAMEPQDGASKDARNMAIRELLMAQAGDWAFLMDRGTSDEYALSRMRAHLGNFHRLADMARKGSVDKTELSDSRGPFAYVGELLQETSLAKGYFLRKVRNSSTA